MGQELADALKLDEIRFIPSANPPHKSAPVISAEHRTAMVDLAIANNPLFCVDDREMIRSGPSYTIDTLESLRYELGQEVSLVLLMGSDAFTQLHTWHRWESIIDLCHISLVERPKGKSHINCTSNPKEMLPKHLELLLQEHYTENGDDLHSSRAGFITMQHITALDISSTLIRELMLQQQSINYLLPDCVMEYIKLHQLYISSIN